MPDFEGFKKRCLAARKRLCEMRDPLVIGHYDADGVTATAIAVMGFRKWGKECRWKIEKAVDEEVIGSLKGEEGVVFVDHGSSFLREMEELLGGATAVVIDHHQIKEGAGGKNVFLANCEEFGFSGGRDASAATTAYCCFGGILDDWNGGPEEERMCELALIGAIGDMQEKSGFSGINAVVEQKAERMGAVERALDLRFYGRNSRSLVWFLCYADEPAIPGLSGEEGKCLAFLEDNGITAKRNGEWISFGELGEDDKKRLRGAIIEKFLEGGVNEEDAKEAIGPVYNLRERNGARKRDAYEYSALINACGRNDKAELGVRVCAGEEGAMKEAEELLTEHKKRLAKAIRFCGENAIEFEKFYLVDARGKVAEMIVGVAIGAVMGRMKDKPIIGFADGEGGTKVSARQKRGSEERGNNLGIIMRTAAEGIGYGGGHKQAAGAHVEGGSEEEFLKRLAKEFK